MSVPNSFTSASRPNFLAILTLRMLAVAWPDGQLGMAITRSAAVTGAAEPKSSTRQAGMQNSRRLFTVPS
ncbi:hypothetical protein D3C71_2215230 [compost metagenome]